MFIFVHIAPPKSGGSKTFKKLLQRNKMAHKKLMYYVYVRSFHNFHQILDFVPVLESQNNV